MTDSGSGADDIANDGIFRANIPEYRDDGDLIEFYIEAKAGDQTTLLPPGGAEVPGMFIVDSDDFESELLRHRFIVSEFSLRQLGGGNNAKFPRMSNQFFNMTFIANESEIYYGCQIRKSGSPFTP